MDIREGMPILLFVKCIIIIYMIKTMNTSIIIITILSPLYISIK